MKLMESKMSAARFDDTIEQGADWVLELTIKDPTTKLAIDLTNYTISASVKNSFADASALQVIAATIPFPLLGKIKLHLTDTQTAAMGTQKQFLYDVFLTDTATTLKYKIIKGIIYNDPKVT